MPGSVALRAAIAASCVFLAGATMYANAAHAGQRRGVGTGSLIPGRSSGVIISSMSETAAIDLRTLPSAERMHLYRGAASCAVKADPAKARRYLDAVLVGEGSNRSWNAFRPVYERCLELTRQIEGFVVPGDGRYLWLAAVNAEAYLRANPAAPIEAEPIASLYQDAGFQSLPTSDNKTVHCLVRTEPARALALIGTDADSADEGRAIGTLLPAIGRCTDSGATVSIKRAMLRLNIAPAYYAAAMRRITERQGGGEGSYQEAAE